MTHIAPALAFVLRKKNLPNQDMLITFFTHDHGRIYTVAKGIKKITSRRLPHLQTGNLVKIQIRKRKDRWYLEESVLISAFSSIKSTHTKLNDMYCALLVVDRILPQDQSELKVFENLKNFCIRLSRQTFHKSYLYHFLNALLLDLGYIEKALPDEQLRSTVENLMNEKLPENTL